jgi:hypothetical protein
MQTRHRRVISSWIAILAILLNALMPTVSMALESSRGQSVPSSSDWIEVCSVQGSTWVRLDSHGSLIEQTDRKPVGAPASAHDGHCPYCLTHAASFGLPPVPVWVLPVWPRTADLLPQRTPLALPPVAWLAPAARAPPTSL